MKSSSQSALVMLAATGLVGSIAWFALSDRGPIEPSEVALPPVEVASPNVMNLTPYERRLKGRVEAAERKIEDYKQRGEVLDNGTIKVKDVDGSPLYVYPELLEGTGRFGEPKYLLATFKRRAPVPLRELRATPKREDLKPKLLVPSKPIKLKTDEMPDSLKALQSGGSGEDGDGESGGGGNKEGKKGAPPKKDG